MQHVEIETGERIKIHLRSKLRIAPKMHFSVHGLAIEAGLKEIEGLRYPKLGMYMIEFSTPDVDPIEIIMDVLKMLERMLGEGIDASMWVERGFAPVGLMTRDNLRAAIAGVNGR